MTDEAPPVLVGIDLGTTYSCIAYIDDVNRPTTIKNSDNSATTPSVVYFENEGNTVVGEMAKNAKSTDPDRVVDFVKVNMGIEGAEYDIDGKTYRPEEVSALVLKRLVQDAKDSLQREITKAVITVPAYFGENQRTATSQAGKIAGLEVLSIIDEPTAAAFSHGVHQGENDAFLVYDLGGGTFDVTLVQVADGGVQVLHKGGEHELGGKLWDDAIMNYLASAWGDETGRPDFDLENDTGDDTRGELRAIAETAKKNLTAREKVPVMVQIEGERVKVEFTREKFDELTSGLLERTIDLTRELLEKAASSGAPPFNKILLVGGSTRMPQVSKRLQQEFPQKEVLSGDPDEAVAKGAALYARNAWLGGLIDPVADELPEDATDAEKEKARADKVREIAHTYNLAPADVQQEIDRKFVNVTSRAFGVVAVNQEDVEEVAFILHRDEALPAERMERFGTRTANMRSADIRVMEAESEENTAPEACTQVGNAILNLPPDLPQGSPIEITFRMTDEGMLEAVAREVTTGAEVPVSVDRGEAVMSDEQVQQSADLISQIETMS